MENHLSARASSTQQYEQGSFKDELLPFMSESSLNPWNGISSIGLFAPANAQTFEQFPEDESSKKKRRNAEEALAFDASHKLKIRIEHERRNVRSHLRHS